MLVVVPGCNRIISSESSVETSWSKIVNERERCPNEKDIESLAIYILSAVNTTCILPLMSTRTAWKRLDTGTCRR